MSEIPEITNEEEKLEGIRGWLLFYGIILGISILRMVFTTVPDYLPSRIIPYFSEGSGSYHPAVGTILLIEGISNFLIVMYLLTVLYFFCRKRKFVPKLIISFYCFNLTIIIVELILALKILPNSNTKFAVHSGIYGMIRVIISLIIWGLYFTKSKRVKNTFVN